ncbi:MAG: hypothetical protein ACLP07_13450 [Terracidiphilus sp.]
MSITTTLIGISRSLKLDSGAARVLNSASAPGTAATERPKIIKENIWDVSPTFRQLTSLESTNRFRNCRKNAPNYVELVTDNPFKMALVVPKIATSAMRLLSASKRLLQIGFWL